MPNESLNDEFRQRAEWRHRLIESVLARKHNNETLCDLLMAGFDQAQSDGMRDAAAICARVANGDASGVLAHAIRTLDDMNNTTPIARCEKKHPKR